MEQRQHPRFLVRMRTILGPPDAVEQEGTVYNVSVGGCAVLAEHLRGTDMMTSLHLYPSPATEPIIIAGAVRRWGKAALTAMKMEPSEVLFVGNDSAAMCMGRRGSG